MISTVLVNCQHWKSQFQNFVNEITGEERAKKKKKKKGKGN